MSLPAGDKGTDAGRTGRGRELLLRLASAALLAPIALAAVWLGGIWFAAFVAAGLTVAGAEWRRLCGLETRGVGTLMLTVPVFLAAVVVTAGAGAGLILLAVALAIAAVAFGSPASERVWAAGGLLVIGLAGLAVLNLRSVPGDGAGAVLFLFLVVWLADIGGYAVGRAVGGPKLAPRISPGKTWAGLAGAIAFPAAGAAIAAVPLGLDGAVAVGLAVVLAIASQAGDLAESWVKRRHGAKDSGTLIPGHGGILDRIDGLLFAAPVLDAAHRLTGVGHALWQ